MSNPEQQYSAELPPVESFAENSPSGMSLRRKILLGTASMLAVVVPMQNLDEVNRWRQWNDEGSMVPEIPGCPEYIGEQEAEVETESHPPLEAVLGVEEVESGATRNINGPNIDLLETTQQIINGFKYHQDSFVSSHSGLEFRFFSDQPEAQWTINHESFDDVFHYGLTVNPGYEDPEIINNVSCLSDRFIDNQEFAGETYYIHIPNEIKTCLGALQVIDHSIESNEACEQSGVTPPKFEIQIAFWKPISKNVMILTGGKNATTTTIEERITQLTLHESMHAYLTLTDTPLRLNPDERWVHFQEEAFVEYMKETELPSVITYDPQPSRPEILSVGN